MSSLLLGSGAHGNVHDVSKAAQSDWGGAKGFVDAHRDGASAELFGIADLSAEFDVTPRAIRFYESKGLLSPRRVNGARIYDRRDRARLALILRAKSVGSSLAEIKEYLELYGEKGEGRIKQLRYVIDKTDAAITDLETKKAQLETTLSELRYINRTCREQLQSRGK